MKKNLLAKGLLLAFLVFAFTSCDNEPVEGEFPDGDDPSQIQPGEFRAEVDGDAFVSVTGSGILDAQGTMILTALDAGSGDIIELTAEDIGVGDFNLTVVNGASQNIGEFFKSGELGNPYQTIQLLGGSGQLVVTEFDAVEMTISGTFSIIGGRLGLTGMIETVEVSSGVFNKIPYILNDNGDDDDDDDGNPLDSFSANVDNLGFALDSLSVERKVISDIAVIRIIAIDSMGARIRVDVPELLGVGTHEMVSISNGTELIGLYNDNTGGENLTSDPGSITITEFNTVTGVLTASFAFTGTDPFNVDPTTVSVSQGQFTVHYVPDPNNPNTPFTAEVDDIFFNPGFNVTAVETIVQGNNVILISAASGTEQIEILFPSTLTTGTYGMSEAVSDGDEIVGFYIPEVGVSPTYTSNPGELIITAINLTTGQLEGTFNFTASDPTNADPGVFEITDGMFTLVIQ